MPRKADAMLASEHAETQQDGVLDGIDQYQLPQSTVTKIAKAALPPNAKLQKESVLALVKGSTVFINYIAAAAQEVANARGHKTITSSDVLQALELTNFGDMVPGLNAELEEYRSRVTKNPSATKKSTPAAPTQPNKGKSRASSGKATTQPVNGKPTEGEDAGAEEEPYSEPDVPGEDDEEGMEPEGGDRHTEGGSEGGDDMVDRMEVDNADIAADTKGLESREESSGRD